MPPKIKITREEIVEAAVSLVRESGAAALIARSIAARLGCSTQPIFSNFTSMEDLTFAVVCRANELCREWIRREEKTGKYPPYKASGMGYIRFAKEEKELFRLLYMRDRSDEGKDEPDGLVDGDMEKLVRDNTGLDSASAKRFHLEMWAVVHGIATMFATGFVDLEWDFVSGMITDVYQGLRKQYGMEL